MKCSVETMKCLACSPDLNPIENLWGILVRREYTNNRQFCTVMELESAICFEWANLDLNLLKSLVNSMKSQKFCIAKANGCFINYFVSFLIKKF